MLPHLPKILRKRLPKFTGRAALHRRAHQRPAPELPPEPQKPQRMIKDDPRYAKYFKMVNFGVPKPVVTMKFQQETGLDPALLDTPEAAAPPGGEEADGDGSDGECDEDDDRGDDEDCGVCCALVLSSARALTTDG